MRQEGPEVDGGQEFEKDVFPHLERLSKGRGEEPNEFFRKNS